ncbi:MAG: hypothetical protein ACLUH9_13460 [Waltera sp.]
MTKAAVSAEATEDGVCREDGDRRRLFAVTETAGTTTVPFPARTEDPKRRELRTEEMGGRDKGSGP